MRPWEEERSQVFALAKLAPDGPVAAAELSAILDWFASLRDAAIGEVAPLPYGAEITCPLREDEPFDGGLPRGRGFLEASAPVFLDGHLVVPRVL